MSDTPTLPNYGGVRYPHDMSPFKAGSLLFKVATVGSKDGKILTNKKKASTGSVRKPSSKSGLTKNTIRTITSKK